MCPPTGWVILAHDIDCTLVVQQHDAPVPHVNVLLATDFVLHAEQANKCTGHNAWNSAKKKTGILRELRELSTSEESRVGKVLTAHSVASGA